MGGERGWGQQCCYQFLQLQSVIRPVAPVSQVVAHPCHPPAPPRVTKSAVLSFTGLLSPKTYSGE